MDKRKIFLILIFFGFALNFLFRQVVHMALLVYDIESESAKSAMDENAKLKFFYGFLLMQVPSGRLAEIFGGKAVLGFGILVASLLSLITPFTVQVNGYDSLTIINLFIGMALAGYIPAVLSLTTKWIPTEERGQVVSVWAATQLGSSSFPLALQFRHILSKELIFIIPGIIGIVWTIFWYFLVYESPLTHPRISREEMIFVVKTKERQGTTYNHVFDCPWSDIFFDSHVWMICTVHTCYWFPFIFITTKLQDFLKEIFGLNPVDHPIIMLSPFLVGFITIFLSGFVMDFLQGNKIPLTALQKTWTLISTFCPAIALVGILSFQDSIELTLFFYVLGLGFSFWAVGGHYMRFCDMAPNFAGTLNGIAATMGNIGLITIQEVMNRIDLSSRDKQLTWENRHCFVSALFFTAGTLYTIFGNNYFADWNIPNE